MPLYNYRCTECRQPDTRVAGLDDHLAVCHVCRGVMLRVDQDIFAPVFNDDSLPTPTRKGQL